MLQDWIKLQNLVQNEISTLLKKSSPRLKLCAENKENCSHLCRNLKKESLPSHTGFLLIKGIEKKNNNKKKTILRPLRIVVKAPCSDGKIDLYLITIKVLNYLFSRIIDVLPIPEVLANQARNQMMLRYKRKETSTTQ